MKRITIILLAIIVSESAFAQGSEDAYLFSQEVYEGTARSLSMGNAFTALGGDLGGVAINPAGSAVLNNSQLTFTPSIGINKAETDFNGTGYNDKHSKFGISNFGVVTSMDTGRDEGLVGISFGIVYNRKFNFNTTMLAGGDNDETSILGSYAAAMNGVNNADLEYERDPYNTLASVSWPGILAWNTYLLAPFNNSDTEYMASTENQEGDDVFVGGNLFQYYDRRSYGSNEEYAFNLGFNLSDQLYLGVNMNFCSIDYTVEESFSETADDPYDFQDGFDSMEQSYWRNTTGAGLNFKFGAIFKPVPGFRMGATFTTPTWYSLTDNWDYFMTSRFINGHTYSDRSAQGLYDYAMTSPMRWSLGIAYTFGRRGLLSFDYEGVDYSSMKLRSTDRGLNEFRDVNKEINHDYTMVSNFRVGGEFWVAPQFAIRGGYNYYGSPCDWHNAQQYINCGLGFNVSRNFALDIAYTTKMKDEKQFTLYDDYAGLRAPVGTICEKGSKLLFTMTLKF